MDCYWTVTVYATVASSMVGPRGAKAPRANTPSLADTKGRKNLSEQVICTKSAGNGAELCVDAP